MFRRTLFALIVLAVAAAVGGCAQAPPAQEPPAQDMTADLAKLEADAQVWFEYYAAGNAEGLGNLYAEDALLTPPGAPAVTGRTAIGQYLGEDAAKFKEAGISIKPGTVTGKGVDGDLGWISGNYTVIDASGATIDSGNYLSVHRRSEGNWLYIRDMWNSDRAPAAPEPSGNQ